MRHGRAKAARKTLQFFERTIGIQSPYHVLIDGTFIVAATTYKVPLIERIERLLQHGSSFTLYCTDGTLNELQMLLQKLTTKTTTTKASKRPNSDSKNNDNEKIEAFQNAIDFIKENCQIIHRSRKEEVTKTPSSSNTDSEKAETPNKTTSLDQMFLEQCSTTFDIPLKSVTKLSAAALDIVKLATEPAMVSVTSDWATTPSSDKNDNETAESNTNKRHKHHRYICASQDEDLLDLLRQTGQVPIIRLARGSVLLLEQPSAYAQGNAVREEKQKWNSTSIICTKEKQVVDLVKQQERDTIRTTTAEQIAKKRKVESELYGGPKVLTEYDRRQKKKRKRGGGISEPNPLSCKKKKSS